MNAAKAAQARADAIAALARMAQFRGSHPFVVSKRRFLRRNAAEAQARRLDIIKAYLARRQARIH